MTATPEPEIAPCPFCGEPVRLTVEENRGKLAGAAELLYVHCGDCWSRGPYAPGRPNAVVAWNRRVPAPDDSRVARLEAELRRREWSIPRIEKYETFYQCPSCLRFKGRGHAPGCTLAAALEPGEDNPSISLDAPKYSYSIAPAAVARAAERVRDYCLVTLGYPMSDRIAAIIADALAGGDAPAKEEIHHGP